MKKFFSHFKKSQLIRKFKTKNFGHLSKPIAFSVAAFGFYNQFPNFKCESPLYELKHKSVIGESKFKTKIIDFLIF